MSMASMASVSDSSSKKCRDPVQGSAARSIGTEKNQASEGTSAEELVGCAVPHLKGDSAKERIPRPFPDENVTMTMTTTMTMAMKIDRDEDKEQDNGVDEDDDENEHDQD